MCFAQRARWLESEAGRLAVADLRHAVLDQKDKEASRILDDKGAWRSALQALGQNGALPIHDHPGTRGWLCVVSGELLLRKYDVLQHGSGRTAILINRGMSRLGADEYDWFGLHRHNLHALESGAPFTLVFSIRQHVHAPQLRSAYAFVSEAARDAPSGVAITKPLNPPVA